jgi:hypothetical protein
VTDCILWAFKGTSKPQTKQHKASESPSTAPLAFGDLQWKSILNPESNALYVAAAAELMKTTRMLTWSNIRNTLFQEDMRINSFFEMLQYHSTTTKEAPCQLGGPYNYRFGETRDTPIKPTIEFRQRVCPLDVEEIHAELLVILSTFLYPLDTRHPDPPQSPLS